MQPTPYSEVAYVAIMTLVFTFGAACGIGLCLAVSHTAADRLLARLMDELADDDDHK